jgi:mevalonate kinase
MAKASAKIIISGEHAVVYGAPALGSIVPNLQTEAIIQKNNYNKLICTLKNFNKTSGISITELSQYKNDTELRYQEFLAARLPITSVLLDEYNLIYYLVAIFCEKLAINPTTGISVEISSNIPIGAGMGSSAALIVSILRELSRFFDHQLQAEDFFQLAHAAEKLQHGYTSGFDVRIIMNDCLIFSENKQYIKDNKILSTDWFIINSGSPQSSTGQAVAHARNFFNDPRLLSKFSHITKELHQAILDNNLSKCISLIKKNHRLLCRVGVVPMAVQNFIQEVEAHGGAAKISGAGSVVGSSAGCLIACGIEPLMLKQLCLQFGYELITPIMD